MIKVLQKVLDVLELLGKAPTEQRSLDDIASETGINRSTCARIIRDLEGRGYVERRGERKGFYLGPLGYLLPHMEIHRPDLIEAARPVCERCSREFHTNIVFSTCHQMKRYVLFQTTEHLDLPFPNTYHPDTALYCTMSGRLMLALMPAEEREAYVKRQGLPGRAWPEVDSETAAFRALKAIQEQDYSIEQWRPESARYAFPVRERGQFVAVMGGVVLSDSFSADPQDRQFTGLREASQEIGRKVSALRKQSGPVSARSR